MGSWLWKVLLRKFPKEYPDIELELSDLGTMDIVTLLKQEELEVGYGVIDLIHDDEIESRAIRGGELKMIVSCSHPFASQPMISIDMLENEPIIMYRMGSTLSLIHIYGAAGVRAGGSGHGQPVPPVHRQMLCLHEGQRAGLAGADRRGEKEPCKGMRDPGNGGIRQHNYVQLSPQRVSGRQGGTDYGPHHMGPVSYTHLATCRAYTARH